MKSLAEFIFEAQSTPLTNNENEVLSDWFEENVENYKFFTDKGTFAVYFPDRETLKNANNYDWKDPHYNKARMGMSNIPHITISKPARLKGGFAITVYKIGRWAASEFPDPRRAFDENGRPKYSEIEDVIKMLEKHILNGKWANDLEIKLKK